MDHSVHTLPRLWEKCGSRHRFCKRPPICAIMMKKKLWEMVCLFIGTRALYLLFSLCCRGCFHEWPFGWYPAFDLVGLNPLYYSVWTVWNGSAKGIKYSSIYFFHLKRIKLHIVFRRYKQKAAWPFSCSCFVTLFFYEGYFCTFPSWDFVIYICSSV